MIPTRRRARMLRYSIRLFLSILPLLWRLLHGPRPIHSYKWPLNPRNSQGCLMSPISKGLASFAVAAVLSTAAAAQGLVTQKNIPLAMAQTIANAALTKCESMGFKVSVVVVDRDGLPIVMLRGDGSGLHTPEGADRKAYTARTFSQPSAAFTKRMLDDPNSVGSRQYSRVLALSGGLPIKAGDDVVGAVGVSGSPGKDDICSQAGIDKVADLLN